MSFQHVENEPRSPKAEHDNVRVVRCTSAYGGIGGKRQAVEAAYNHVSDDLVSGRVRCDDGRAKRRALSTTATMARA